jgi:hypothetical protein
LGVRHVSVLKLAVNVAIPAGAATEHRYHHPTRVGGCIATPDGGLVRMRCRPFCSRVFVHSPRKRCRLFRGPVAASLLPKAVGTRPTRSLRWRDLATGRLAPRSPCRNGGGATFFPWARTPAQERVRGGHWLAHSSRGKKVSCRHPPLRSGPAGASSIAHGLSIAIETAMVAGSDSKGQTRWLPSAPSRRSAKASSRARSTPSASDSRASTSSPPLGPATTRRATASVRPRRSRGRLGEALRGGPRLPLGQARRSESLRADLRQPL